MAKNERIPRERERSREKGGGRHGGRRRHLRREREMWGGERERGKKTE